MEYNILIDYDNLTTIQSRKGLLYNIEVIAGKLTLKDINSKNLLVRLYGGWYENNKLTKVAQNLTIEIGAVFPTTVILKDQTKIVVNVQMANSLIIQPQTLLYHTYRKRGIPSGLGCDHPIKQGCISISCPVKHVYDFIFQDKCSECKHVKPEQLLNRSEQKLVDSMITADIIYLAQNKKDIAVVSSDDDFWPAILTATSLGINIKHFHTKGIGTNSFYTATVKSNYTQIIL